MPKMRRGWILIALSAPVIAAAVVVPLVVLSSRDDGKPFVEKPFNASAWRAAGSPFRRAARGQMYESLADRVGDVWPNRYRLHRMLGDPDQQENAADSRSDSWFVGRWKDNDQACAKAEYRPYEFDGTWELKGFGLFVATPI
ncbi:MAG: hypothetical protein LC808_04815 [Actinobacteria bacterium]|nr:hypothetical protein [Actinomycetota bacterium]